MKDESLSITQQLAHVFIQLGCPDGVAVLVSLGVFVAVPLLISLSVVGFFEGRAAKRDEIFWRKGL